MKYSSFLTDWEYEQTFDSRGITWHLWSCLHRDGYTAYQITPQPNYGGFVKPITDAHYISIDAVKRNHPSVILGR